MKKMYKEIRKKVLRDRLYAIAFRKIDGNFLFEGNNKNVFTVIKPSFLFWYADPFVFSINGKEYIFVEKCNKVTGKGKLSCFELKDGTPTSLKDILKEDFHLSFPNVFKYDDEYYMIPETEGDKSISIYKMKNDIQNWERIHVAGFEGIVDSTVMFNDNDFLIITSKEKEDDPRKTKTMVFSINNFPNNIKLSNVTKDYYEDYEFDYTSRNAGKIIHKNNKFYRVIQNSNEDIYGLDISINEMRFTKNGIKEKEIKKITFSDIRTDIKVCSKEDELGIHTYNFDDNYEVVDLYYDNYSLTNVLIKTIRKIYQKLS